MRVIIPCAGYGTRMGMDPNKSKELLLDDTGNPIIEWCLSLFSKGDIFLIIREGKQDLIDYAIKNQLQFIVVPPTLEWPDTILKSKEYWAEDNLLILPDTRFEPFWKANLVGHALCHSDIVLGTHKVDDISKWGAVKGNALCEKPQENNAGIAWGFIGFKNHVGQALFQHFLTRNKWTNFHKLDTIELDSFADITRKG